MARGAKADRLKGKFSYIAPERVKSLATDCRTDIYSLGVMLYLVFTGQLPFTANSDAELLRKIVKTRPRPPGELAPVDPRIERLILRAMQPNPAKRYQNVGAVLADLTPCLEGQLGAYGQHDVASFVCRLFETPETDAVVRELPQIPPPPRFGTGESEVSTRTPPPGWAPSAVVDEIEIEDSSSILSIAVEGATPEGPEAAGFRVARGSAWNPPLVSSDRPPLESLTKLFTSAPAVEEPRTTVQSLFGERPSSAAFGPSKLFDRPALGMPSEHVVDEPADAAPAEPTDASPEPQPAEAAAAPRGGFGSYSSVRRQKHVIWPWTSSRTKSD